MYCKPSVSGAAGIPLEHVKHYPFGEDSTITQLRAMYSDSSSGMLPPAAFLVEPIQAEGGVNIASQAWLKDLCDLAKEFGSLVIFDDIQAGCGRTGSYFSFDGMGLDPDIICLAKGIGGMGTPMAMNLVKPEIDKHWSPGEHTGTFRGQCLSFVAGSEALSYFEDESLMEEVAQKAATMRGAVDALADRYDSIEIRGKGMIIGVDVGNGDLAKAIVAKCFGRGLLVSACGSGGRVVKLIPPLTIPNDDLNTALDILVQATAEIMEAA
ncbi:Aminotransferase class-III [Spongiibacter sp. IMCC21906]|uniref:aminotransferase class III-fold pyridoxal phosphate-dependent enzyme n=1 Tax=Spongiibacter sp. IMCC21906 TaxID=1620392 RepID=UPI00062DCE4A|nr:aminotransferase class III-fold pyridoxal phosphate-dependent enzyme [Spongiibacter sp. IMCC21906]AKH70887.1 Aminotransferase class-III [Spongiibacter sp. IMCC21906]